MANISEVDSSIIIAVWNDIKDFGASFWVFMFIINVYWLKDLWINFIKEILQFVSRKMNKKPSFPKYTKKDIEKHRLFKDIDYWLKIGISALHIRTNHADDELDYVENKEKMAKELFRIKLEVDKEYLTKFIEEVDFDNIDSDVCGVYFQDCTTKMNITQKQKFIERGISSKFLTKYYVISDMGEELISSAIKSIFNHNNDINTTTKVCLALNAIDTYLNVIYENILSAVDSINGDLKGESFDGEPMCKSFHTMIKPPHPTYPMIVKEKLEEITNDVLGARAFVIKYFTKNNESYHSAVYEYAVNGVTSELMNIQMINDDLERNVLNIMKENGSIAADISKFGANTIERFNRRGVKGIIISPIINDDIIDGALVVDYLSSEYFNKIVKDKELDAKVKKYAESLAPYIVYPKNYEF